MLGPAGAAGGGAGVYPESPDRPIALCDDELHRLRLEGFDTFSCTDETRELDEYQRAKTGHVGLPRRQRTAQEAADKGADDMTHSELLKRITARSDVFGGKPIIRDMRLSVELILSLMAQGVTAEEILSEHPELEPDDIRACVAYAHAVITAHGRVVAELVQPGAMAKSTPRRFDELVASGVIRPPLAAGDPTEGWPDIRLPAGTTAELIDAERGEA